MPEGPHPEGWVAPWTTKRGTAEMDLEYHLADVLHPSLVPMLAKSPEALEDEFEKALAAATAAGVPEQHRVLTEARRVSQDLWDAVRAIAVARNIEDLIKRDRNPAAYYRAQARMLTDDARQHGAKV